MPNYVRARAKYTPPTPDECAVLLMDHTGVIRLYDVCYGVEHAVDVARRAETIHAPDRALVAKLVTPEPPLPIPVTPVTPL